MLKYGSHAWISKLAQRRAIRDFYRRKFFNDHGFSGGSRAPLCFNPDPSSQLEATLALFDKAREDVSNDTDFLDTATATLGTLGLGLSSHATMPRASTLFSDMSLTALATTHFLSKE